MKSHRRCVFQLKEKCKWTTRSSLEQAGVKIEQDVSDSHCNACPNPPSFPSLLPPSPPSSFLKYSIPHMWVEGNLVAGSKCIVCQRPCGSVLRLQDFRCVWCKWTVSHIPGNTFHSDCIPFYIHCTCAWVVRVGIPQRSLIIKLSPIPRSQGWACRPSSMGPF